MEPAENQTGATNNETGQEPVVDATAANIADGDATNQQPNAEGGNTEGANGENKDGVDDKSKPGDANKEPAKKVGAPEKYELNFGETEEGGETPPTELVEEFTGIAKELNLDQEQAQKLANLGPKMQQAFLAKTVATVTEASKTWTKTTANDKEISGGSLPVLKENLALARTTLDRFGSPELKELFGTNKKENPKGTGLGNHPEVIRFFLRVGKAMSEDKFVAGGNGNSSKPTDAATMLYGSNKK